MNKTETNKTARQILFEHGIDIMYLEDDFNCQLFHAMERYKETAAPPPASEGEMTDAETVIFFELKNKKYVTKSGFEITTDMLMKAEHFISDDVRYIKVPLATLPTREQRGEKEKFAIRFSEWLMIQCEYKNHCVWEYLGEEYTQNELIEIFKLYLHHFHPHQSTKQSNQFLK